MVMYSGGASGLGVSKVTSEISIGDDTAVEGRDQDRSDAEFRRNAIRHAIRLGPLGVGTGANLLVAPSAVLQATLDDKSVAAAGVVDTGIETVQRMAPRRSAADPVRRARDTTPAVARRTGSPDDAARLPAVDLHPDARPQGKGIGGHAAPSPRVAFAPCLMADSRVLTMDGERRVADLKRGDLVMTVDNGLQPLRWTGACTIRPKANSKPVRVKAGALGNARDLVVAPQHRIVVRSAQADALFSAREVLVPAQYMVNGTTIVEDESEEVTFVHLLFDQHELIYAEGVQTESVYPGRDGEAALSEAARQELACLFPELADLLDKTTYGPAARLVLKKYEAEVLLAST